MDKTTYASKRAQLANYSYNPEAERKRAAGMAIVEHLEGLLSEAGISPWRGDDAFVSTPPESEPAHEPDAPDPVAEPEDIAGPETDA